jgi:hypothetical protein
MYVIRNHFQQDSLPILVDTNNQFNSFWFFFSHCGFACSPHFHTDKGFLTQNDGCYRYENDEKSVKMVSFVCSMIPMNR